MSEAVREVLSRIPLRVSLAWRSFRDALVCLVPHAITRAISSEPCMLSIRVSPANNELSQYKTDLLGRTTLENRWYVEESSSLDDHLRRLHDRWGGLMAAEIVLPESACLVLERSLPVGVVSRIDEVLVLEMERATPLCRAEVYSGHYELQGTADTNRTACLARHVIVKRATVRRVLEALERQSIQLSALAVEDAQQNRLPVDLRPPELRSASNITGRLSTVVTWAAIAALSATLGYVSFDVRMRIEKLDELSARVAAVQKQAIAERRRLSSVNATIDRAQSLRLAKSKSVLFVTVWEELSRLLPSSAWLTQLQLDRTAMTITGFAQSATELIAVLSHSKLFKQVQFITPVTRDARRSAERFSIRLDLRPGNGEQL
jgi:general secretion pathway protein L